MVNLNSVISAKDTWKDADKERKADNRNVHFYHGLEESQLYTPNIFSYLDIHHYIIIGRRGPCTGMQNVQRYYSLSGGQGFVQSHGPCSPWARVFSNWAVH